ncbi:MAG: hypothetical protein C5B53_06525, partial [Candidatus Melainabacteria bacterium]
AQGLLAVSDITGQEFASFCKSVATNSNLSADVRGRAILGLSACMLIAAVAEQDLVRRLNNGEADRNEFSRYLIDSFGATRQDLETCLRLIAANHNADRDLRALCAAALNAGELGEFRQSAQVLQTLANSWRTSRAQPAGSFATTLVSNWARELSQRLTGTEPPATMRRVFLAANALGLLSDASFRPVWQAQDASLTASLLTGNPNLAQIGNLSHLRQRLTPELVNDALISCVRPLDPEIAVRAVVELIPRIGNLTPEQISNGIVPLTAEQISRLRRAVIDLLSDLRRPGQRYQGTPNLSVVADALATLSNQPAVVNGLDRLFVQQSEQREHIRNLYRQRLFELLPQIFISAPEQQWRAALGILGDAASPRIAAEINISTPELRSAATTAIGRLLAGRSLARNYVGNQNGPVALDGLQALVRQPHFSLSIVNQNLIANDSSLLARLEAAVFDPAPSVRRAAVEALLMARPLRLSNGRTLQEFCIDLLQTETDPAVLVTLRRVEFLERAPDPTSPDYIHDFQRARHDLLFSLHCRGERSLAGMPQFIFANLSTTARLFGTPNNTPYNAEYHSLNRAALRTMALGNNSDAMNALKAIAYIIVANGRPFERGLQQSGAVSDAVAIMRELTTQINPGANAQRARDALWALELCLVLNPNLSPANRKELMESYISLLERMPADPSLRHRAAIVAGIVLERDFVSSPDSVSSEDLQTACLRLLGTYRTRATMPILEIIHRANRNTPITAAARTLLEQLRADPNINRPGTLGGPLRGSVAFDEAYEILWQQIISSPESIYVRPFQPFRIIAIAPNGDRVAVNVLQDELPPGASDRTRLLRNLSNGAWFRNPDHHRYAPYLWHLLPNGYGLRDNPNPERAFTGLLELARRNAPRPNQTPNQQATELRLQSQARLALAWIVAVNGEGLVHSLRDDFVARAAQTLAQISSQRLDGLADLDFVIESTLVGQPLMSQDRAVRNHMITALWNRCQTNRGSITNPRAALILAGALRSEYQTMPRPHEQGFEMSCQIQTRILDYLQQLGHRMCAPVVEALAMHHPVPAVRARAEQTLITLYDNVWRLWSQTANDNVTAPTLRANALRTALNANGEHNPTVQAILSAYRGRPVITGDPRYQLYLAGLSDQRPHVRLACSLVALRAENTAFSQSDRERARTICAHLALHGLHIGMRQSARSVLIDNLPNGVYRVQPVAGTEINMVKTANSFTLCETTNGRVSAVLLNDGRIRRFFYDDQNRLSRYISEDNTEYSVVQRNNGQLTWSNGRGLQFVSPDQPVTIDGALQHGIRLQISRVDYPDGFFREFRHDGETLVYLNENGTQYERIREGNAYTDVWRINGSNTNLWIGPMYVTSNGVFTEFRRSSASTRTVHPDGRNEWATVTQTLRMGNNRELTVYPDGRHVLRTIGAGPNQYPNATVVLENGCQLQQFAHGGSVLRRGNLVETITYSPRGQHPEWPPVRHFEYNSAGDLIGMRYRLYNQDIRWTRILDQQNRPTRQWRQTGDGITRNYTGLLFVVEDNHPNRNNVCFVPDAGGGWGHTFDPDR